MAETNEDNQPASAIDRAKNKNTAQKKEINWSALGKDVLNFLLKLIIIFLIGSRVVFACKVAQANILPTDLDCMPYTPANPGEENASPKYESDTPEANIDVSYIYDKDQEGYKQYATIIGFQINESSKNDYLLDKIRKIEYDPKVNPMIKYLCVVIKSMFVFYYGITSSVFNFMNSNLNESLIILLGPYLLKYLSLFIYPVSVIVSIIFCLLNLGWLMKSNKNNDKDYNHKSSTEPVWRPCDPLASFYNLFGTIIYLWIGFILAFAISMSPIPAVIALICILTPLFMKAKIINPKDEEKSDLKENATYGFGSSVKGLIESKLDVFMIIFCIFTTYATYLNSTDIKAPIFVGLASMWFLYKTIKGKTPPQMATDMLVSYDKNEKICPEKKPTEAELAAIARDEQESESKNKEDAKNGLIARIIAFWISIWTWLPRTAYSTALQVYNSVFGPDPPCPAAAPESVATALPVATTLPVAAPAGAAPAANPLPNAPQPPKDYKEIYTGGGRKRDLLRKINNLKRSLKHRSK